jgi:AAHS family 4-hydroxybenzoate transporter-like MFS transporter
VPAILLWIGLFCMFVVTYLLVSWTPTMAVRAGLDPATAARSGVTLSIGGVLGALAIGPLVNRYGPFVPVAIMVVVSAGMIVLLGHSFDTLPMLMIVLFFVGLTALGGQLNCPAMSIEIFPMRVRGAGAGWTLAIGRIGSIVGPLVGGYLLAKHLDRGTMFVIVAIPTLVAGAAFALAGYLRPVRERQK